MTTPAAQSSSSSSARPDPKSIPPEVLRRIARIIVDVERANAARAEGLAS